MFLMALESFFSADCTSYSLISTDSSLESTHACFLRLQATFQGMLNKKHTDQNLSYRTHCADDSRTNSIQTHCLLVRSNFDNTVTKRTKVPFFSEASLIDFRRGAAPKILCNPFFKLNFDLYVLVYSAN